MSRRRSTNAPPPRFAYNHTHAIIPGTKWVDPRNIQYPTWLSCEAHRKQEKKPKEYKCVQDDETNQFLIRSRYDYEVRKYEGALNICNRECFPTGCGLRTTCVNNSKHKNTMKNAMEFAVKAALAAEEAKKAKEVLNSPTATNKERAKAEKIQKKADEASKKYNNSRDVLLKPHQERSQTIYKSFQCDPLIKDQTKTATWCSERTDFTDTILRAVNEIEVAFDMEEYAESLGTKKKTLMLQQSDDIIEQALEDLDVVYEEIEAWAKEQNTVIRGFLDKVLETYDILSTTQSSSTDGMNIFAPFFSSEEVQAMYKLKQDVVWETLNMQMFTGLKHEKEITRFFNRVLTIIDLCGALLSYENYTRLQKSGYVWAGTNKNGEIDDNYVRSFIDGNKYLTPHNKVDTKRLQNVIMNAKNLGLISDTRIAKIKDEENPKRLEKVVILLKNLMYKH